MTLKTLTHVHWIYFMFKICERYNFNTVLPLTFQQYIFKFNVQIDIYLT
jgi:hypothetical protein